jgi:hypothetical protein
MWYVNKLTTPKVTFPPTETPHTFFRWYRFHFERRFTSTTKRKKINYAGNCLQTFNGNTIDDVPAIFLTVWGRSSLNNSLAVAEKNVDIDGSYSLKP